MQNTPRIRPTPKILFYAAIDVIGIILFATGALWLFQGGMHLFIRGFPNNTFQAVATLVGGLLLMVLSVAKLLREVLSKAAANLRRDE